MGGDDQSVLLRLHSNRVVRDHILLSEGPTLLDLFGLLRGGQVAHGTGRLLRLGEQDSVLALLFLVALPLLLGHLSLEVIVIFTILPRLFIIIVVSLASE